MPTVEEDTGEGFEDVPEEILEQMPDDLLNDPASRDLKGPGSRGFGDIDGDEDETEESTFDARQTKTAPAQKQKSTIFEESFIDEDEDEDVSQGLVDTISAVNEVYEDMGNRSRTLVPAEHVVEHETMERSPVEEEEETPVPPSIAETVIETPEEKEEKAEEELVSFASSSPFQTEYDPVTGVYRLKAREPESGEQQQSYNQDIASDITEPYTQGTETSAESQEGEQLNLFAATPSAEEIQTGNEHQEQQAHETGAGNEEQQVHEHGHDHSHEHGHDHSHEHGHDHSHEHGHDHSHDHGHEHGHEHTQEHAHEQGHEQNDQTQPTEQETFSGYRDRE